MNASVQRNQFYYELSNCNCDNWSDVNINYRR